jgi:hypothetical protein
MTLTEPATRHPIPTTPADLPTTRYAGVDLLWLGEDGDQAFAYGHVTAGALTAAVREFAASTRARLDPDPGRVAHVWAVREVDGSLPPDAEWRESIRWVGVSSDALCAFAATVLVVWP